MVKLSVTPVFCIKYVLYNFLTHTKYSATYRRYFGKCKKTAEFVAYFVRGAKVNPKTREREITNKLDGFFTHCVHRINTYTHN